MRKLDYCIGTHNTEEVKNGNVISTHANLYHIKNKYVVDFRYLLGGACFSCQVVKDCTMRFNSMKEVDSYYGKGYFKPVIDRLPTMYHD